VLFQQGASENPECFPVLKPRILIGVRQEGTDDQAFLGLPTFFLSSPLS